MTDTKDSKPNPNGENNQFDQEATPIEPKVEKPKKIEDKPFEIFINDDFLPSIKSFFEKSSIDLTELLFKKDKRPVIGGECWMIYGEINNGKKFWLCFSSDKITSSKQIAIAEGGNEPSLIESFLIDERKITLPLLLSRLLQRLNGQKLLGKN